MKLNTGIRINRSLLLEQYFNVPPQEINEIIQRYREMWIKREPFIMQTIEETTGLTCKKNLIDAYVVDTRRKDAISSPIIIGAGNDPKEFVRILAHEFIHILAIDNTQGEDWSEKIQKLYPNEPRGVAIHIMVHAILEAAFDAQEIKQDILYCDKFPEYKRSWQIVQQDGYSDIIRKLKSPE